ncbi:MAG: DUF86 domain-containing protein [Candidatus Magasanikbacteria bacterium]|nr:DUF86 domain-containing protein [Candidatus Magasanikbacteria bacterium]
MKNRDSTLSLLDILESTRLIEKYIRNYSFEDFSANRLLQDGILRRLEIIGEAVKQLPKDIRDAYPDIPWKDIAGMRDILAHEYFRTDLSLAWRVCETEIPKLKRTLCRLLKQMENK